MIITIDNKSELFRVCRDRVFVRLNIKDEVKEEIKFKNSAFVKTGRMIPTGKYTANELQFFYGNYRTFTLSKINSLVQEAINKYIDRKILTGFIWNNKRVWLSEQNQQNYSSWLTAAKSNSEILPLKAKFNDPKTNNVVYHEFTSVKELEDFYAKMVKHINDCVNESRQLKDNLAENAIAYNKAIKENLLGRK